MILLLKKALNPSKNATVPIFGDKSVPIFMSDPTLLLRNKTYYLRIRDVQKDRRISLKTSNFEHAYVYYYDDFSESSHSSKAAST